MSSDHERRLAALEETVCHMEDALMAAEARRVRLRRIRLGLFVVVGLCYAMYFKSLGALI